MAHGRYIGLAAAVCCLLGGGPAAAEPPFLPLNLCEQAGIAAERASGLPAGLLLAIGQIESGRWDAARARVVSWPWTIDAAGKGQWYETKDAAVRAARGLLESGIRLVDVGCFQISLPYHPTAFADLDQAFDPAANAAYAARFLLALRARTGDWNAAVEAYHSADPARGAAYRQLVLAAWLPRPRTPPGDMPIPAPAARATAIPAIIAGVQVWTPMPRGTAPRVVAMPPPVVPAPALRPAPVQPASIQPASIQPAPVVPTPVVPTPVMPVSVRAAAPRTIMPDG